MRHRRIVIAAAASSASLLFAAPAFAAPAPAGAPRAVVVSQGVFAPFQLAYHGRSVFVGDGSGTVFRLTGKALAALVTGPHPGTLEGVAVNAQGTLAYTSGSGAGQEVTATSLTILKKGHQPLVVNTVAFEKKHDPDGNVQYGIKNPSACVKAAFKKIKTPASYRGSADLEGNAYAVAPLPGGSWVVADAGGNDLLKVSPQGKVSLITVIPPTPYRITAKAAKEMGLATCTVGKTYKFEPVPTDVEVGPKGALYVSTLPGGPGTPPLPPLGSVYRVTRGGTDVTRIATGFAGATNLAISPRGVVYVAEASIGVIARASHGHAVRVLKLPNVLSLVWGGGFLWAGTAAPGLLTTGTPTGPGTIVRIRL